MAEQDAQATILVVDDERGPRESLRMILEPLHHVLQAASGAEALEALRTQPVDLVTLDLNMPGMKGQDVMRTVRRDFPQVEVVVITGCGSVESAAEGIRYGICDYLQKPFDVVQVGAAVTRGLTRRQARARLTSFLAELGDVVGRERNAHALLADVQRSHKLRGQLGDLFQRSATQTGLGGEVNDPTRTADFLEVLAETIENKDQFLRGHARRVAFYSSLLADRLNLSAAEHELVRISAFLHDLGKVGVPTDLLLREGSLDATERDVVERHPEIGARLIKPLDIDSSVALAIRHHHERWDGSGYPDGLAGEEIPFAARVIGVADAFDAMTCDRPYRPALTRERVCAELRRGAGGQFDPNLAKEFLAVVETGICEVDPEFLADALAGALRPPQAVSAA
jgi:putative nucleotidyltransferase with HDIG domain